MNARLPKLRQRLAELDLDAILISHAHNRRYLSGFTGSAGYLLISPTRAILATDFRYVAQSKAQAPEFEIVRIAGEFPQWLPQLIAETGARRIGFESADVSVATYHQLLQAAREVSPRSRPRLIGTNRIVESLRTGKDADEIASIRAAAAISDAAQEYARRILRSGLTERGLAWELEKFMREKGGESLPFEIIVASGPDSALPHARPTDREILPGTPVVIDLGARINGYTSDITRTICLGEPGPEFIRIYQVVRKAQSAALQKIRAGMTGQEADNLAREVISKAGFGEKFGHGLGHGVGLETHELPRLGPNSTDVLADGMVFTVEPGIYVEGWGGVRIEDMVSLENGSPNVLTGASKLSFPTA